MTILQDRLEQEGWIVRRQDGDTDFGVDAEIEIVRGNSVTGRLIKCQVKTSKSIAFKDGEESVSVSVAALNLWRATPLLTILFHVDRTTRAIYWTPALAHQPRSGAASLSIRFEQVSDISNDLSFLTAYLDSWFSARAPEVILTEIAPMNRIYTELTAHVDHYDAWTEVWDETEEKFFFSMDTFYVCDLKLDFPTRPSPLLPTGACAARASGKGVSRFSSEPTTRPCI